MELNIYKTFSAFHLKTALLFSCFHAGDFFPVNDHTVFEPG